MGQEKISVIDTAMVPLPTRLGDFIARGYVDSLRNEHLVLIKGDIEARSKDTDLLCRVHSECLTGNVFQSLRCDCEEQLLQSMHMIEKEGLGIFIYLRQEGRGIGLVEKLKAYGLQDKGYDTYDANVALGHEPDLRDYFVACLVLKDLGIQSIRLLSNNPDKIQQLEKNGIKVAERIPLKNDLANEHNREYLRTKAEKFGHYFDKDFFR